MEDKIIAEFKHEFMQKKQLSCFFQTVRKNKYANIGLFLQGFFCDKNSTLKQLNRDNILEIAKTYDEQLDEMGFIPSSKKNLTVL